MLNTMWFPEPALHHSPIMSGLSLCHRHRPLIGPYLLCTFARDHQFVCDTIVATTSLSTLGLDQLEQKTNLNVDRSSQSDVQTKLLQNARTILNLCLLVLLDVFALVCTVSKRIGRVWPSLCACCSVLTHPYLLLTYLTFVAYWPSLWADLVFDDRPAIIENKDLREEASWSQLWLHDYWGTPLKSPLSHKSYRPVTVTTFRLNYLLHQLDPFGYHLANLLLHLSVSILFYRLCLLFVSESSSQKCTSFEQNHRQKQLALGPIGNYRHYVPNGNLLHSTSFYISLLFCAHPIHTDCVSSVVGRAELLSAIFYLSAILVWTSPKADTTNLRNRSQVQLLLDEKGKLTAIPLALVGFLCKEQSILVLVYLCLFESNRVKWTKAGSNVPAGISSPLGRPTISRTSLPPFRRRNSLSGRLVATCLLLMSLLAAIYVRLGLMQFSLPTFNRFDNPASRAPFPSRHLTYAYLCLYHFWLLLLPLGLSCDWTHASIELIDFSESRFAVDLFRSALSVLSLVILSAVIVRLLKIVFVSSRTSFLFRLKSVNKHKLNDHLQKTLHALALTLIPFVPASNLFFPTGFVIAERILYLPSIGFLLLIAIGVHQLTLRWPVKRRQLHPIHLALVCLLMVFCFKTYSRSVNWSNEYSLYKSGLEVNPTNTKLLNNLGRLYEKKNQLDKAIEFYQKAIRIESKDIRSHLNLGNALFAKKELNIAEEVYRHALAQIENELFEQTATDTHLAKSLSNNPTLSPLYLTALVRLAELINYDPSRAKDLEKIKQKMAALHSMTSKLSISNLNKPPIRANNAKRQLTPSCGPQCEQNIDDPIELNYLYNMAIVHYQQGHFNEALQYFDKVLILNPFHEDSLLVSARIIQDEEIDRLDGVAFDRLTRLVQLGKDDSTIYFNLAMLSVKAEKNRQARHYFEKAISQKQSFAIAHYNLALVLVKELNSLGNDTEQHNLNVEQALFHLKKVLAIKPNHVKSMLVLGDLYAEELSLMDTSRLYYQMVIGIEPDNLRARHNLCVLWHKQNNLEQAIQCFEQLRQDLLIDGDVELVQSIERIQIHIQVLRETSQNEGSKQRLRNKLVKWSKESDYCHNESNYANLAEETNYNKYKHLMVSKQMAAMCLI